MEDGDDVDIYAPKTSAIVTLPVKIASVLSALSLKDRTAADKEIIASIRGIVGVQKAKAIIDQLVEFGVLVRQENVPDWDNIPEPDLITPVDVMLVVANYPCAGDVPTPVPFGLMLIASALRNRGLSVSIVDMALERLESWQVVTYLRQYQPKAVGVSAITAAGIEAGKVACWTKRWAEKENPDFKGIVLGGHHAIDFSPSNVGATRYGRWIHNLFDVIVTDKQAFDIASEVFLVVLGKEKLRRIPGVIWRNRFKGDIGGPDSPSNDSSWRRGLTIPTPSWDLIKRDRYSTPGATFWGMGCPFSCTYCTLGGVPTIYRPLAEVIDEWLTAVESGVETIVLLDDEIFHNPKRTLELVDMIESKSIFRRCRLCLQSRVDSVVARHTDNLLQRLRSRVNRLYLEMGIDGLTKEDLYRVRKGGKVTINSPYQVIRIARELGIDIGFGTIFGFPWNTKDELYDQSQMALSFLREGRQVGVDVTVMGGAFTPFPGSSLGKSVIQNEIPGVSLIRGANPEHFDFHRPIIDTPQWNHQYLENFLVHHFKSMIEEGG